MSYSLFEALKDLNKKAVNEELMNFEGDIVLDDDDIHAYYKGKPVAIVDEKTRTVKLAPGMSRDSEFMRQAKEFWSEFDLKEDLKSETEDKEKEEKDKELPLALRVEDYQKWVDYDMEHYGEISERTNELIKKAGFQIIKDDHGDYEVAAGHFE